MEFPAARFVMMAMASQAKRTRLRDALLLLLRVLAVAMIALAFDRPAWLGGLSDSGASRDGGEWVVVVDASASMSRSVGGRRLFDEARDGAARLIGELDPAKDRAAVVIAAGGARSVLPRLTGNLGALAQALEKESGTLERGDIAGALALARSLPMPPGEPAKPERTIVIFSDLQRGAFAGVSTPSGCRVVLKPVGAGASSENLAVTSIGVTPARPVAGQSATIAATVINSGSASRSAVLTLRAPGAGEPREATAEVPAGGEATVTFPVKFDRAGMIGATVSLADQPFEVDDAANLVVEVRAARRVALVTGSRAGDLESAAYFVGSALRPGEGGEFQPVIVPPGGLEPGALDAFDGVVLCEAGAIDDAGLRVIGEYASRGGGVVWFIDSQPAQEALARFARAGEGEKKSAALIPPIETNGGFVALAPDEALGLRGGDFQSPMLRALEGPAGEGLLRSAFSGVAPARLSKSGAAVLAFATGEPFLSWTKLGLGRLVVVSADVSPRSSALVKSPLFPVLMQEVGRFIEPAAGLARPALVGGALAARLEGEREPAQPITDSLGRAGRVSRAAGGGWFVTLPAAAAPGLLELRDGAGSAVGAAAVNLDPAESDLRSAPAEQLAAQLSANGRAAGVASAGDSLAERRVTELWPVLVAAALLALALEAALGAWDGFRARAASVEAAA